ncbi:Protein takeout [Gryllus bimaculatus]|nr:Protein takeout [Gryllus bimaculatus]
MRSALVLALVLALGQMAMASSDETLPLSSSRSLSAGVFSGRGLQSVQPQRSAAGAVRLRLAQRRQRQARHRIQFSPPYIEFVTTFKNITLAGPYEFGGSILTFRINGNGDSYFNWGSNVTHRLRLEEEERNGEVYWRLTEFSWQQDIFHLHSHFKNLFRGNKRLGIYANQFLNRNWRASYALYGPIANRVWSGVIKSLVVDPFFARVPVSKMFAP